MERIGLEITETKNKTMNKKKNKNSEIDKIEIFKEYVNTNIGIEALAKKYHVGKLKIKAILTEAGIEFKKRGQQQSKEVFVVNDWRIEKYPEVEGKHYVAVDKNTGFETADYNNRAGVLTTHINKEYGVEIPTLYDRRKYYMLTGDYWWEQWFEIKIIDDKPTKKCPYCGWETVDVENRSGAFEQHLQSEHNMSVKDYLQEHPEDLDYFPKYKKEKEHRDNLNLDCGYVVCPICGQRFERISPYHLKYRHGMTWGEFIEKYPKTKVISEINVEQAKESQKLANLTVSKDRFISKYEKELQDFLNENNIEFEPNRQILIGKEIDILIPSLKLGIEFNGLKFHTEFFGKKAHRYHLDKTVQCNEKGYKLIHIFEDEFVNHKEIVYNKLRHAIGLNRNLPKVGGRKCEVKTIYSNDAKTFLNENHIQGFSSSSVYYCYVIQERNVEITILGAHEVCNLTKIPISRRGKQNVQKVPE